VINDIEANAYEIASLEPSDFAVLNQGVQNAAGDAAFISAGTGLGRVSFILLCPINISGLFLYRLRT
jgi:glucokinase